MGAGISILEYYDIIGENRINRSPMVRCTLSRENWTQHHILKYNEMLMRLINDLVSRKIGENLMKKKGPEGPLDYATMILI